MEPERADTGVISVTRNSEGKTVFVVEGEKDADALAGLGLCATCNPGGAGKWQDEFTATLTGVNVVIVADKDTPGRNHAAIVAGKPHGKAKSVRVIELPDPNGQRVKDAADWIQARGALKNCEK